MRFPFVPFIVTLGLAACSKETPRAADTTAAAPQGEEAPAPAPAATPTEQTKVGQMALLTPLGASPKCATQKYGEFSAIKREVTYEGDFPVRVIKVAVGDSTRAFAPINMEITVRREAGVGEEGERLTAIFTPNRDIQFGRRDYFVVNSPNQSQGLFAADTAASKQIALQVLEQCDK